MTISAISSTAGNVSYTSEISRVQQKIEELEKKITQIQSDDSLDAEDKQQQMSAFQTQLTQYETQLAQLQRRDQTEEGAPETATDDADNRAKGLMGVGQFLDEDA